MTTTTTTATTPIVAKRIAREYKRRHVAFWDVASGNLISERGTGTQLPPASRLSTVLDILEANGIRTLYVMGGESAANTPKRAWWAEPAAPRHDSTPAALWRFDGYEIAAHAAGAADATENAGTYTRGDGERATTIDVRMSALWFPGAVKPRECRDNWNALQSALARTFDSAATLLATPAATGLDLLERSLPRGASYPLAPQELRDLLYGISGQGRFEFCPSPDAPAVLPGLWWLDARWMYAACVRNLPTGTPTHTDYGATGADADEGYLDHQPGWYRVDIQVPSNWRHRGLIATRRDDGERIWPAEPGEWLRDVWTSGAELAVALRNRWPCLIHERWVYERQAAPLPDPTRAWAYNLRTLRLDYANNPAIAAALRHLLIDTVGMWHRRAGEKLRITPPSEVAPGARVHHVDRRAGLVYWYETKPLSRSALPWQRPEWSATTWNRAAARENTAALRLPVEILVGYRSDALVVCERPAPAAWLDDGQPGTFRLKSHVPGPLAMPADAAAMLALRNERDGEGE